MSEGWLTWYPADGGDPISVTTAWPCDYKSLRGFSGLTARQTVEGTKRVGAAGVRGPRAVVGERVVRWPIIVKAHTADVWTLRQRLNDAMTADETGLAEEATLGLLRLALPGQEPWELAAVPLGVVEVAADGPHAHAVDLEWYCPDPYWRELADRTLRLTIGAGGAVLPWTLPVLLADGRQSATLDNPSPIAAALTARFVGPLTRPRLLTAGGNLTVRTVAAGETVTVTTAPRATVEVVTDGVTVSGREALARLDWTDTVPFTIARSTTVELVADGGTGHVDLAWRVRRAGL